MKVGQVIQLIERDGWVQVAQRGSYRQFKHPTKPGRTTIAGKPVSPGQRVQPSVGRDLTTVDR